MLSLRRIRWVRALLAVAAGAIAVSAFGQGVVLNIADNPIDLNGGYLAPSAGGMFGSYARATTDPSYHGTSTQVVEVSNGIPSKKGTFTPFNETTKWPARMQVDLTGRAFQFELDIDPANPSIPWENSTFAIGAGSEIGNTVQAVAQVEVSKNGPNVDFNWRSGLTTSSGVTVVPASPAPTQFRIRVEFNGANTATLIVTPLNNVTGPVNDYVQPNLPIVVPINGTAFVSGFLTLDGATTNHGMAVVSNFVTTAGDNQMWMMAQPYRSTNPLSDPTMQTPVQYMIGMSNPTERVHAWQGIVNPLVNFMSPASFLPGIGVFDTPMIAPFDGTLDPSTYGGIYPNGVIRAGAFSIHTDPTGTENSSYLASMTFGLLGYENYQMPAFIATDPAGGPAPAITTLQGSGYANIPTALREASQVLTDNTPPAVSQLFVIQDGVNNPPILHQGPIQVVFRAEDFGLPLQGNLGTGLLRYPRAVLRPASNSSNAPGVQSGDFDLTSRVYPDTDNIFQITNLTIGTPGTLDVPCGNYRLVVWDQDKVGLISTPSNAGTQNSGYAGVTPNFEIRKFNSLTMTMHFAGFNGIAPDPIHQTPPLFQRWVTITIGGAPGSPGANSPVTYQKYVLLDPAGNGTVALNASDGLPCPGGAMYVSVKDPQHSLRKTVPITLTPNTSDYLADLSLTLGDLNNDNRVGIGDFGVFLANFGIVYSQNDITNMGGGTHCDLSGNRRVGFEDYLFIQNSNNVGGDSLVGSFKPNTVPPGEEATRIRISNLLAMGIKEAPRYDLNKDGWVTWQEMQQVLVLKNMHRW